MALTETQKSFRKYQKELGNYKKYKGRRRLGVGTGLILFVLASLLFQLPQRIHNEYQIYHHKRINNYLNSTSSYSKFLNRHVNPLSQEFPTVNIRIIQNILKEHDQHMENIESLIPVSSFQNHHASLKLLVEHTHVYLHELERIALTSRFDSNYLNNLIYQLNKMDSQVTANLIEGFRIENIEYHFKEDGVFEYIIRIRPGEKLKEVYPF